MTYILYSSLPHYLIIRSSSSFFKIDFKISQIGLRETFNFKEIIYKIGIEKDLHTCLMMFHATAINSTYMQIDWHQIKSNSSPLCECNEQWP